MNEIIAPSIEPTCWICDLVERKKRLLETKHFIVLPNMLPYIRNDGQISNHLLVCSKRHVSDFDELSLAEVLDLGILLKELAKKYKEIKDEFAILLNNKTAQSMKSHFHIQCLNHTDWKKDLGDRIWGESISDELIQKL